MSFYPILGDSDIDSWSIANGLVQIDDATTEPSTFTISAVEKIQLSADVWPTWEAAMTATGAVCTTDAGCTQEGACSS